MQSPPNEQVRAGEIAQGAIQLAQELCRDTIDGKRLDREIEQYIRDEGGEPALKGYHPAFAQKPYEYTICLPQTEVSRAAWSRTCRETSRPPFYPVRPNSIRLNAPLVSRILT